MKLRIFSGEMIKKPSFFLQGVNVENAITYNPQDIEHEVWKYYNNIFDNNQFESLQEEKLANSITELHKDKMILGELFCLKNIINAANQISKNTIYGPDFIHPHLLEDKEILKEIASKILHTLITNNWIIPEELRISRLLVLTKNASPTANINETRPIAVQSLPIRIIEKLIKFNLLAWQQWKSTELPKYQTGFQQNMSTMINLIRIKSLINRNRRRTKNKKYIFFLDITKAFNTIGRKYILKGIRQIIDLKTKQWNKWRALWAFSTQLLKSGTAYYGDGTIQIKKGVPQGGVLSPMFFTLALHYILTRSQIWRWMIRTGRIIAYTDDIAITVSNDETQHIHTLINHLKDYGLHTNTNKFQYIGPSQNSILDKVGQFQNIVKYLGCKISYHKREMIKSDKSALKKNIQKWKYIKRMITTNQYYQIINVYNKSVLLYQSIPGYITGELSIKNI